MFESLDTPRATTVASQATVEYLQHLLDGHVDAGLISKGECQILLDHMARLLSLIGSDLGGEPFWHAFQNAFGFATDSAKIIPMNAANLCPEPTALIESANVLRSAYNRNVAQQVRTAEGQRVRELQAMRAALANALGLPPERHEDLALIRNSSEGNNQICHGYYKWNRTNDIRALDKVVVWAQNHPTNLEAWRMRRDWNTPPRRPEDGLDTPRPGDLFELVVVDVPVTASIDEIRRAFIEKIDARTRFVTYSETSNGNGMRIPEEVVAAIWAHVDAHHPDCHIHIDGTMSWGARPVNLGNAHCHSFVSSAHKWFLGPKETAMFYMRRDKVPNFMPSIFAYDYRIGIPDRWRDMPATALRFEMLGQRDDVNLITLHQTQIVWNALMTAERAPYARVAHLATLLKRMLLEDEWRLVTPMEAWKSSGVVRIEAPKKADAPSLYDWIYTQGAPGIGGSGGTGAPRTQTFRLCPHIYNTEADVRHAVARMNAWRECFGD